MADSEFWPDPFLDYDKVQQENGGNKPLSVMLDEILVTLESLVKCTFVDHIQGTNASEWRCPECKETYTSGGVIPYCSCKLVRGHGAVTAAKEVRKFLDKPAAELLDRGYVLNKGECMEHHTDSMSVKRARVKLFRCAAEAFLEDRTTLKLESSRT